MAETMSNEAFVRQSVLTASFENRNKLPETELLITICLKALAEAVTAVQAIFLSIIPTSGASTDKSVSGFQIGSLSANNTADMCLSCEPCISAHQSSMATKSSTLQEYSPAGCKAHDEDRSFQGPDTSVRVRNEEISAWLAFAKSKEDDDDEDDDDEDEDDEDEDEDEDGEEEGAGEDDEGEEGIEGGLGGEDDDGGDDDEDEDEEDEDGKGGDEEDEDEDGVEGEEEEDEDGVDEEEDEDDEDDEDETPEPPPKKRK